MQAALKQTLRHQRNALEIEPIHAELAPVQAYAKHIGELKGEPFSVVTIPEGTAAHGMGFRFVSIPDTELEYYLNNGARVAGANVKLRGAPLLARPSRTPC